VACEYWRYTCRIVPRPRIEPSLRETGILGTGPDKLEEGQVYGCQTIECTEERGSVSSWRFGPCETPSPELEGPEAFCQDREKMI
jgi:hypothetical protein